MTIFYFKSGFSSMNGIVEIFLKLYSEAIVVLGVIKYVEW